MSDPSHDPRVLRSWKEIAAKFGVSARTVQSWEADLGLPVHRNPGAKGRVYAYETELDDWMRSHEGTEAQIPDLPATPRRRSVAAWVAVAVLLAAVGGLAFWRTRILPPSPIGIRVEKNLLIALGANEGELWRYRLEAPHTPAPDQVTSGSDHLIADLNGDGSSEVVCAPSYPSSYPRSSRVLCFSSQGKLLWRFEPGRLVRTKSGHNYPPPFVTAGVHLVRLGAERGIGILVLGLNTYFPFQAALLSPDGRLLREYWHAGHIQKVAIADLDHDGMDEIYLGGISNQAHQAALVVLRPDRMAGADLEPESYYQLAGFPSPVEEARIHFARIPGLKDRAQWNQVTVVVPEGSGLRVHVREPQTIPVHDLAAIYHFSPDLRLLSVDLSDNYEIVAKLFCSGAVISLTAAMEILRKELTFATPPANASHLARR